ncbi:MAG TPA: hypothetical protein VG370_25785 [Chloroflexota bacterium]|nr:hypothetical protein [Chloroflexota bacterium]
MSVGALSRTETTSDGARPAGGPRRPRRPPGFVADLGALAAIALIVAWQHWRPLFEPGVWLPAGGGDLASLIYPNYRFAAESLRQGDFPFWNPYIQSGAPFVADIQSGVLYPINLVVFSLAPSVSYRVVTALVLFHLWLAGALAYACGRGFGLPRLPGLFAGVAFALSDLFVIHVGNPNTIAVASWIPLLLLCADRAARGPAPRWIGLGALGVAMAALAGHAQPLLFGLLAVALTGLFHAWPHLRRGQPLAAFARLWPLALFTALGLAAAAAQLVPAAELTALSGRRAIPYETSVEYSLNPGFLVSFVVPAFYGRGPDAYWGQWLRSEGGYVGVLTLVLAAVALAVRPVQLVRRLALLAAFALLLALGGATGLHALFYRFVPLFGSLRGPARTVVVTDLALALLAGFGLALLLRPIGRRERRAFERASGWIGRGWLFVLATVPLGLVMLMLLREHPALPRATGVAEGWTMLALWLGGAVALLQARRVGWLAPATLGLLAVGWLALDLVSASQGLEISKNDPRTAFERPAVFAFLRRSAPEPYRIDTDTGVWDVWQPNSAMVQRVPDVVGGIHPLELADFRRYWSALGSRSTRLYDLLNATYLVARKDVPLDWSKFELAFDGDPELNVYRNQRVLPRAQLIGRATVAPSHQAAFELIQRPGFDPSAEVAVEGGDALSGPATAGGAHYVPRGTSRLDVEVTPTAPAYLLLSEVWYPGWRAWVDGRPVPVRRADYLFRAIRVEPGDRVVQLRFEPTAWRPALALTLLSWLAIAVLLASPRTLSRWTAATRRAPGSASG